MEIDWVELRRAATEAMRHAYAPYSSFPVGAAGLVDDGRVVVGCNVENAGYGVALCAECGVVSSLHSTGGGRLVALSCVGGDGRPLMPCGRCRQLLWEHGGPECLVEALPAPLTVAELLPHAFGPADLAAAALTAPADRSRVGAEHIGRSDAAGRAVVAPDTAVPARLARWRGRGTVFVHPDSAGGEVVWTGYWERSESTGGTADSGILEEAPSWPSAESAVAWGRARTHRVVVVDADGTVSWAGEGDPPAEVSTRWAG
ncbi:cytidine deaminase [Solwaraspora sp. WMMD406]|uniref:cytidine deaminase n=1 Tax=Solwaraspora sp. WMMD406 TaxID=3016095 RepID=UPI002415C17A|nr:cytidine deaminase [Solwaraspora sp. WMMD406]MDG4767967.1 cytidine deaminase [Solwaraspora sp. WMMD406]